MNVIKLRLEYPNDGGAVDVEAETIEELFELANNALQVLWGKSARQMILTTLDDIDKTFGINPRGRT